jgi:adenylyl-sulfate kinase
MVRDPFGAVVWMTGLPASGKTTMARALTDALLRERRPAELLDGDIMRATLSLDVGFDRRGRDANVQRIGLVARLLARHGVVSVVACISPYAVARAEVRHQAEREGQRFVEVYLRAPSSVLIERDPKGLYRRALAGHLPHFTGVSDPYEEPTSPDAVLETDKESIEACLQRLMALLRNRRILAPGFEFADLV